MDDHHQHPKPVRTLRQQLWGGIVSAHRRRPISFYLLLSIPVVLVLALNLFQSLQDPKRFAFGLSILFIFLGVVLIRAILDIGSLVRTHLAERRKTFKETIGDDAFLEELRANRPSQDD